MNLTDSYHSFDGLSELTSEVRKVHHPDSEICDSHTVSTVFRVSAATQAEPNREARVAPVSDLLEEVGM